MSFSSLSPDFRESLRNMADEFAVKKANKEKKSSKQEDEVKPTIRISSELEQIIEITDEGTQSGADNK